MGDLPYGHYQSADAPLLLNSRYVVEVFATNRAGSTSSFYSKTVTVDFSPPTCTLPTSLAPISDDSADVIVQTCAAGGPCGVYNYLEFMGTQATGIRVTAAMGLCADVQSDIASVALGVGDTPSVPNLSPFLATAPPQTGLALPFAQPPTGVSSK